jgi:hypothetical protein
MLALYAVAACCRVLPLLLLLLMLLEALNLALVELYAVAASCWVLLCFEVVQAEAKPAQQAVAQLLQLAKHLFFEFLLASLQQK